MNDVALYLPTSDAWAHLSLGRVNLLESLGERIGPAVVEEILASGYGFDFVDDRALERLGRIDRANLVLGSNRYRAIVLPGVESIPVATVRKLAEFARAGGIVLATRRLPAQAPGFMATAAETAEVRETVRRLFEAPSRSNRYVAAESGLGGALTPRLQPDVSLSPRVPGIGFVHRSLRSAEVYFLANTDNVRRRTEATFRIEGLQPEYWDPLTGNVLPAEIVRRTPGAVSLPLDLEPYGSRVIVFSRGQSPKAAPAAKPALAPIDLSADWQVRFGEGEASLQMEHLRSWTENEGTRFFSGLATYEKTFAVPESYLSPEARPHLNLGDATPLAEARPEPQTPRLQAMLDAPVREAAVVEVNGKRAGSVWCPPYSVEVTGLLKRGENRLRIVVANLAINDMAGHAPPDYRLLNLRYGVRFEPQDVDQVRPIPSGLLGPITLTAGPPPPPRP